MNRGQKHAQFVDALARSRDRGFHVGVHLMLGLPGEDRDDMLATADYVAGCGLHSVKLHNLYAVKNTPLGEWVTEGKVRLLERGEYVSLLVDVLERLPPGYVIERTAGEAPPDYLIGPAWCLDKPALQRALEAEFERRDTWQGKCCVDPAGPSC